MFNLDLIVLYKIKEFIDATTLFNVPVGLLLLMSTPIFYFDMKDKRKKGRKW